MDDNTTQDLDASMEETEPVVAVEVEEDVEFEPEVDELDPESDETEEDDEDDFDEEDFEEDEEDNDDELSDGDKMPQDVTAGEALLEEEEELDA